MTTPSGQTGQLVQCSDTTDCYAKAREVCNGDYRIVDSASRSMGNWGSMKEITVECGAPESTTAESSPSRPTKPVATKSHGQELDDASAPESAAGFKKLPEAFADPKRVDDVVAVKMLRIRYEEGRTPDPAKTTTTAEGSTEADREVSGL